MEILSMVMGAMLAVYGLIYSMLGLRLWTRRRARAPLIYGLVVTVAGVTILLSAVWGSTTIGSIGITLGFGLVLAALAGREIVHRRAGRPRRSEADNCPL